MRAKNRAIFQFFSKEKGKAFLFFKKIENSPFGFFL